MIHINIGGEKYKAIEEWSEMTIDQAANIHAACDTMPDNLRLIYESLADQDQLSKAMEKIGEEDAIKNFPRFYGDILALMSDIPEEVINNISWQERTAFFNKYLEQFVIGLLFNPIDFVAKEIDSFEWNEEIYYLPESKIVINDERTFAEVTALEFAESADLEIHSRKMKEGKFAVAANIISILCRKKDERYNEAVSLERAKEFKQLPMTVFWEVFFCLTRRTDNFKRAFLTFTADKVSSAKPSQRSQVLMNLAGMAASSMSLNPEFSIKAQ